MATLERMVHSASTGRLFGDLEDPGTGATDISQLCLTAPRSHDFCLGDFRAGDLLDASTLFLIHQYLQSCLAYLTVTSTSNPCVLWSGRCLQGFVAAPLESGAGDASQVAHLCNEAHEESEVAMSGKVPTMEEYVHQVRMWADMYDQEPADLTAEELAAYYDRIAPFEPED